MLCALYFVLGRVIEIAACAKALDDEKLKVQSTKYKAQTADHRQLTTDPPNDISCVVIESTQFQRGRNEMFRLRNQASPSESLNGRRQTDREAWYAVLLEALAEKYCKHE